MTAIRNATLILIATFLGACSSSATTESGNTNLSVMVLIEDSNQDSIPAGSSVARRVNDAITEQLNQAGYTVYDSTVLSGTANTRARINTGELLNMARNNATYPGSNRRIPIDAAATASVHVSVRDLGYTQDVRVRVTGRAVNVNSGRFLGIYELNDVVGAIRVSNDCVGVCLRERVGGHARDIGQQVGDELAGLLGGNADNMRVAETRQVRSHPTETAGSVTRQVRSRSTETAGSVASPITDYSLRFENIDGQQYLDYEYFLTELFSGYIDLDLVSSAGTTHEVVYRSRASADRIMRNMVRAAEELDWTATVYQNGSLFTLRRTAMRGDQVDNNAHVTGADAINTRTTRNIRRNGDFREW